MEYFWVLKEKSYLLVLIILFEKKKYYLVFIIKINEEELGIFISEGFVNYLKYKYKENWLYFYVYL